MFNQIDRVITSMGQPLLKIIFLFCCCSSFLGNAQEENHYALSPFKDDNIYQQEYAKLPFPRKADIMWQKFIWRKVEFAQTFNQYLYYPITFDVSENDRISLIALIWNALRNGKIKAYQDENFQYELDFMKFRNGKERFDTIRIQISDDTGIELDTFFVSQTTFSPEEVKRIEIKEVWYIDKQRSAQEVRILGFCFLNDVIRYDPYFDDFTVIGEESLFWIDYNEPAVRQLLATTPAFNEQNDANRISYDDVFIQRIFDSYIVKESNQYNRYVNAYLSGIDALLKAEAIKQEIMDKEIDLWEY